MELNQDDRILLMLYGESTRKKTIQELEKMAAGLQADEKDLKRMLSSLLGKLQTMDDRQYAALDL